MGHPSETRYYKRSLKYGRGGGQLCLDVDDDTPVKKWTAPKKETSGAPTTTIVLTDRTQLRKYPFGNYYLELPHALNEARRNLALLGFKSTLTRLFFLLTSCTRVIQKRLGRPETTKRQRMKVLYYY